MVINYIFRLIGTFIIKIILYPKPSVNFSASEISYENNKTSAIIPESKLKYGLYLFEIKLDSFQAFTKACLNINYENTSDVLHMPLKGGNITRRTLLIKHSSARLQLVFNEKILDLEISQIRITNLYFWLGELFLKRRLINRHINTKYDLNKLWALYNETFITGEFSSAYNNTYQSWIKEYESKLAPPVYDREAPPNFSIILYSYNENFNHIQVTTESIERQSYDNWEVVVCCDNDEAIQKQYHNRNKIKLVTTSQDTSFYQSLNRCKQAADGNLIIFLEAGNTLSDNALEHIASYYQHHPDANIFYSDDDLLDEDGSRIFPRFKPDWNKLYFYSYDYLSGFIIFSAKHIEPISFRDGFEEAELYDFLLSSIDACKDDQAHIIHIPRILYHTNNIAPGSKLLSENILQINRVQSLQSHLEGCREFNTLEAYRKDCVRIRYKIDNPQPMVSLVIPTRDNSLLLRGCIKGLLKNTAYSNLEIIIVNNNSTKPDTLDYLSSLSVEDRIKIIDYPHPFNFSAINNYAVNQTSGAIIGLLNDDTEAINPDWLEEMVSFAVQDKIGCVGAKLYYPNGNIQHGGVILGLGDVAGHAHRYFPEDSTGYLNRLNCTQYISAVTGACLLVRKEIYEEVNGLDEKNLTIAYNDVDFCIKVREAGYNNVWTPHAKLYHYESISRGSENSLKKKLRYREEVKYMHRKWGKILREDPYYHPFLTNKREDFSLKF